jgi:magnesium-transporting ATPase (P-type)
MNVIHHCTSEQKNNAPTIASTRNYFDWILRLGILGAIILIFFYVMILNSLATRGFTLEEIKAERITIQKEREKWDIALAIPTSLYALHSSEQVQRMSDIEDKTYIRIQSGEVAFESIPLYSLSD